MDIWVPLKKRRRKNNKPLGRTELKESMGMREKILIFSLYLFLSQIYENLTDRFRRDKHEKCSTRQGLRVGTKNKGFHLEFK